MFATHFRVAQDSELRWQIRCEYDFKYGPSSFGQMPLWAHLLPASLAQRLGSRYGNPELLKKHLPADSIRDHLLP